MFEQSREITRESEVYHYVDTERTLLPVILPLTFMPTDRCYADNIIVYFQVNNGVLYYLESLKISTSGPSLFSFQPLTQILYLTLLISYIQQ